MASIFDLPLLSDFLNFGVPFLLVFALVYAVLSKTEQVSESKSVNSVIAFVIAFITAMAAGKFLMALAPFFATFLMIIFGGILLLSFLGYKPEMLMQSKAFVYGLIIAGILFVVTTAWLVYTPEITATVNQTDGIIHGNYYNGTNGTITQPQGCETLVGLTQGQMFWCILMNPKILGMLILVVTMAIVTYFFVREREK